MTTPKRNCVLVVLSHAVGHELVFRHYTNKVVVGTYKRRARNADSKVESNRSRKKDGR